MKVTKENFNGLCGTSGFGPPDRPKPDVPHSPLKFYLVFACCVSQPRVALGWGVGSFL